MHPIAKILFFAAASTAVFPAVAGKRPVTELRVNQSTQALAASQAADRETALAQGRSLLNLGDNYGALSAFQQALAFDPSSVAGLNGLGIVYDRLGRHQDAREHFLRALSIEPDASDIAYNIGWSYHNSGDDAEAVTWLQRAFRGSDQLAVRKAQRALAIIEADYAENRTARAQQRLADRSHETGRARIDIATSGTAVLVLPTEPSRASSALAVASAYPKAEQKPAPTQQPAQQATATQMALGRLAVLTVPLTALKPAGSIDKRASQERAAQPVAFHEQVNQPRGKSRRSLATPMTLSELGALCPNERVIALSPDVDLSAVVVVAEPILSTEAMWLRPTLASYNFGSRQPETKDQVATLWKGYNLSGLAGLLKLVQAWSSPPGPNLPASADV